MRLLVVGAGSTGGYFGGRLIQAGRDVTFLVRPKRAAQLQATGLQIVSPHGDATVRARVVTADALDAAYDAVLLAVKGYQLEDAMRDMRAAIGAETAIVPVLNGMRHMKILADRFSPRNVVGCALKVAATLDREGRVVQLAPFQEIVYGELSGETTARVEALNAFMQGAGFDARLSGSILREMWEKWIFLAALGGITCLMRGTVGEVAAAPGGVAFAQALFGEVIDAVNAVGVPPSREFVAVTEARLTERGSALASSMYRDLQAGRPIEAEEIVGDLVRQAEAAGLRVPLLAAAYTHLALYQKGRG